MAALPPRRLMRVMASGEMTMSIEWKPPRSSIGCAHQASRCDSHKGITTTTRLAWMPASICSFR